MEDYSKECKKTHDLRERLVATEAMLQGTEEALARVKQQLADLDSMVVGNYLSFC
jgi:bacterioferritin (cytochrome b1)